MKRISVSCLSFLMLLLVGGAWAATGPSGNDARLAADIRALPAGSPWLKAPFVCYTVPAVSSIKRLPDTLPPDGTIADRIMLAGAKGEFLPSSFIIAPLRNVKRLELKSTALRRLGEEKAQPAEIPASNVDIRVVKCLWKPGNAWHSYFGDATRRELTPELLLHDENLVKVDMEKQENYLRVDYPEGSQYVWISYQYPVRSPEGANPQQPTLPLATRFDFRSEPVEDSPVLLPVVLQTGERKQFWITIRVPEDAVPGNYEGRLNFTSDGAAVGNMLLKVRVLPFTLPDPRTYYDLNRPYIVSMDNLGDLPTELDAMNGDRQAAERRLRNLYRNQREHNIFNYNGPTLLSSSGAKSRRLTDILDDPVREEIFRRQLELVREAGFKPPLIAPASAAVGVMAKTAEEKTAYIRASAKLLDMTGEVLGHRDVYFWGAGEPGRSTLLAQLDGWKELQKAGVKIGSEAKSWHFPVAGFAEDLVNLGGQITLREHTIPWRALGHRVLAYANPHPGAENPELSRRIHGMVLYKAWFDGTKNNTWISNRQSWLDFWNPYGYRIKMIYPTRTGVIDTLAWEGFREGIGDVRYATLLKQLAARAIAGGDIDAGYTARKALLWLETHDERRADLNAMRLEMINYILAMMPQAPGGAK